MSPVCPYCRTEIGEAEGERQECPGCGTPHHSDCFIENGGCTVFGCSHAPSDEAKVTVSGTDLQGNVISRAVNPVDAPPVAPAPGLPTVRPGLSLGSGYTTFRAPAPGPSTPAPAEPATQPAAISSAPAVPPPPPPIAGTGVAPPPSVASFHAPTYAPSQLVNYYQPPPPKTRVLFVLLGIFLGGFGVHNFYAGYVKKGTIQLCLTLLTCFYGAALSWPWAIIEICTVNKDADGAQFV